MVPAGAARAGSQAGRAAGGGPAPVAGGLRAVPYRYRVVAPERVSVTGRFHQSYQAPLAEADRQRLATV